MKTQGQLPAPENASAPEEPTSRRRDYAPPVLREYGDLRTLTLGPSPGLGESGNPAVFRA